MEPTIIIPLPIETKRECHNFAIEVSDSEHSLLGALPFEELGLVDDINNIGDLEINISLLAADEPAPDGDILLTEEEEEEYQ